MVWPCLTVERVCDMLDWLEERREYWCSEELVGPRVADLGKRLSLDAGKLVSEPEPETPILLLWDFWRS